MEKKFENRLAELNELRTDIVNRRRAILTKYQAKLEAIVARNFDLDSEVFLSGNKFCIKNNKRADVEFSYGYEYNFVDGSYKKEYSFKMSVWAMGSFDIMDESDDANKYYTTIAQFLSNKELKYVIKETLHDLTIELEVIDEELYNVNTQEDEIKDKIKSEELAALHVKEVEDFNNAPADAIFIIETNVYDTDAAGFTYRKKPVKLITTESFKDNTAARRYVRQTFGAGYVDDYKYIEKSKLKVKE